MCLILVVYVRIAIGAFAAGAPRSNRVVLEPQRLRNRKRLDVHAVPPRDLVAGVMELPVMISAQRDRELVADFHAERPWLGKAQVMRVGWLAPAYKAGMRRYKSQMRLFPDSFRLSDGERAFVDLVRRCVWLLRYQGSIWQSLRLGR